jgi:exosortase A
MFSVSGLPKTWHKPLVGIFLATLACILLFLPTWKSIVDIWIRSETYTHGFLVAPISMWLIWNQRHNYRYLHPAISLPGLLFVFACGFLWMTADLIHVLVVQQWAVVGILVCSIWTIIGNHATKSLLFPILFLFLMVPFGEDFVPSLMEFTATFVVTMLRLTGISVYREGLHFSLTTGNWSVIDACSGIRYLIASITLGLVYMYLNYTSYKKRVLFMVVAVLLPILANGLRGYMIVMIGHLSDMKLATGVDHLIYGWLFFGLVMLLLFYIGSFWQDPPYVCPEPEAGSFSSDTEQEYLHFRGIMAAVLVCFFIWPTTSLWLTARQGAHVYIPEQFTRAPGSPWQASQFPGWGWLPEFKGVISDDRLFFSDGVSTIGLYIANYGDESKGELVNSQNLLVSDNHGPWRITKTDRITVAIADGKQMNFDVSILAHEQLELLVYRWYRVGSASITNNYIAKIWQLFKRLTGDTSAELQFVLYTPINSLDEAVTIKNLQQFAVACCS